MISGWDDLEKWMDRQQLPKNIDFLGEPDWVEAYVRKMMGKALPADVSANVSAADIAETKSHVVVTYPIGENADISVLKLVVKENRIRLSGLPGNKEESVKLPKPVLPRTCDALYDGDMLKIKIRKRPPSKSSHTATIRFDRE